jgi:alkyldihydroxyacetonephosphate synthase
LGGSNSLVTVTILKKEQDKSEIAGRLQHLMEANFPELKSVAGWDGTVTFRDPGNNLELLNVLSGTIDASKISTDPGLRLLKSIGKSSLEIAALRNGSVPRIVDAVVTPDYDDVEPLLKTMRSAGIKGVVSGGLTGVTGGFRRENCRWLISIDTSRLKHFQAAEEYANAGPGLTGSELETLANRIGMTIGHFPESFADSTLGGWIATGASGQESNFYGDIEDILMGTTLYRSDLTIRDIPSPRESSGIRAKQIALMSEGRNGIIGDSTIRMHKIPEKRTYASHFFRDFSAGIRFIRGQMEFPAIARLSDHVETAYMLELASDQHSRNIIRTFLRAHGIKYPGCLMVTVDNGRKTWHRVKGAANTGGSIARKWEENRYGRPEIGNWLWMKSLTPDTMETSCMWKDAEKLYSESTKTFREEISSLGIGGIIMAHISHLYTLGPAIYFTFILSTREPETHLSQIRDQLENQFILNGGSVTHHHGIGSYFRRYVGKEKLNILRMLEDPVLGDCS